MSDEEKQSGHARELRQAAEEALALSRLPLETTLGKGIEDLLHELQVHQVELEMQNEELRRAQLALEESRNRYADLYEFAPIGYFTLDCDGRITTANLTGASLLGVDRQELISHGFSRFVVTEDIARWDRHRLDALQQGETVGCELTLKRESGSTFHARLESIRKTVDDGSFALRTAIVDITESKRAEEALKAAETDYRSLFNRVPSGLYRSTPDGRFLAVNQALVDILGYESVTELMGADIARMFYSSPEERRLWVDKLLQIGEFRNVEIRVLRKDSSPLVLLENARVVRDEAGQVLFFEGSLIDVTDRKRVEEENQTLLNTIQGEKTRLSALIDSIADEVWFADTRGRFTLANQSALREFALAPGEPIEVETLAASLEVFRQDGSPRPVEEAPPLRALSGEVVRNLEEIIRTPASGELRRRQVSSTPVRDAAGMITGAVSVVRDITELKQAEEALRASESSLQTILRSTADGLLAVDQENRVILANQRFEEMWRIPEEIMISKDDAVLLKYVLDQLIDPQGFLRIVQQLYMSDEDSFDTLSFKDGRIFERVSRPLLIGPELRGRLWSFRDVTERKKTEDELRKSEEKYRLLMETMLDGVYRSSHEGKFLEVNPAMVSMLEYGSKEELLAIDIKSQLYFSPEERESATLDEKHEEMSVFRLRKRDGSEIWVEAHGRQVLDDEGAVLCHEGILRDITERMRAEEELRVAKMVVENSPTVIFRWLAEPGWPVEYVTENVTLFGFQKEEMMHKKTTFAEIVHPDDRERTSGQIDQHVLRGEDHFWLEYRLVSPKGEARWVDDHTTVIRDAAGKVLHYEGTVTDNSERKKLEAEVERARMDFIFAVSHELKTPLLIMAAAEEMVEMLPAGRRGERFHEYSDVWKRNLIRLRTNIDNLVDSQRSPGTGTKLSLQSTDLSVLIDRLLDELAPLAEKKDLQVRRELDAVRPLFLDPEACIRIVTNLLTNAIKFSPPSALLRIELREEENQAVLRICDEGPGIPVEEMPNLFQPFRRGARPVQAVVPGTGLGLYVSRILTEAQGGTIELESEIGRGTTAILRFPLLAHNEDSPRMAKIQVVDESTR